MWTLYLLTCLAPAPANLLENPGFELGVAPWRLPPTYTVDTTTAHSGDASLRVENTDPARYLMAAQTVKLEPGRRCAFSAWIRTEGVQGDDSGATICLEWNGPQGWLGGAYPAGLKGTQDWKQIRGSALVPAAATSVDLICYLRKGMVGRAWFDDVEAHETFDPPLTATLLRPGYRGRFTASEAGARASLQLKIATRLPHDLTLPELRLRSSLRQADTLIAETEAALSDHQQTVEVPLGALPVGRYTLTTRLVRAADGLELGSRAWQLEAVSPQGPQPRVYLDDFGRTMVDGKPFFPLGFYDGQLAADRLATMAAGGFNTVMPYGINQGDLGRVEAALDAAQAAGIKVIYNLKDLYPGAQYLPEKLFGWSEPEAMARGLVERFKSHPALLAWYLNDETPIDEHAMLRARYELVRELDPEHPTWAVVYQVQDLAGYADTTDVLGTDPYPIPSRPAALAGEWTRLTAAAMGNGLVWQVPQAFDWANYRKTAEEKAAARAPTLPELRAMTYQCLAEGAKGLIYYSFFDLQRDRLGFEPRWSDMKQMAREVNALVPYLLSTDPAPNCDLQPSRAEVSAAAWRLGDSVLVIAANGGGEPAEVAWKLPAAPAIMSGEATELTTHKVRLGPNQAVAVRVTAPANR
ncbi:MAG: hypothetical protein HUU35_16575 [Armatimonadetes bacterium]|nr:hypothetical protein [Armatimonadota bacterium]